MGLDVKNIVERIVNEQLGMMKVFADYKQSNDYIRMSRTVLDYLRYYDELNVHEQSNLMIDRYQSIIDSVNGKETHDYGFVIEQNNIN